MKNSIDINSFGKTDIGVIRKVNEDAIFISDDRKLMAVLDGVGGSSAGQVASEIGIATLTAWYEPLAERNLTRADLEDALVAVDAKIREAIKENPGLSGMATTACIAYIDPETHQSPRLHIAHIGDSRAYLRRKGALLQLTLDHSWHNAEILQGHRPLAEVSKLKKNSITHSLGSLRDKSQIEYSFIPLYDGDIVMLSTDGIHDYMEHSTINQFLAAGESATANEGTQFDAQKTLSNIVEFANAKGGQDNASIILAKVTVADGSATNLLPKHNAENWLLGKESGELVYGMKVASKDDERLDSFYRISTPAGHSLLVKDKDGLAAVLRPPVKASSAKVPQAKEAKKSPLPEATISRKKTSSREYLIGAFAIALLAVLAWLSFGDDTILDSEQTSEPAKQRGIAAPPSATPSHLIAVKKPAPASKTETKAASTDAAGEETAEPIAVAQAYDEAEGLAEPKAERKSEPSPRSTPKPQDKPKTEGKAEKKPEPGAETKLDTELAAPVADADKPQEASLTKVPEHGTAAASEGEPKVAEEGENVLTEAPAGEVYTAGSDAPRGESNSIDQGEVNAAAQEPSAQPKASLDTYGKVNSQLIAAAKKKRIEPKARTKLMGRSEPLLANPISPSASDQQVRAYDSLGLNYLTIWLLDNRRAKPSQDQKALIGQLVNTVGSRHATDSYFQTVIALAEARLLGQEDKAIERLQSSAKNPSQYIYDNLALAQMHIAKGRKGSKKEHSEKVLAAISPLVTNDLNYMKLYRPSEDVAYIKSFGRLYNYSGVYSFLRKNLPKKDSKYLNCRLQFLEMRYTRSCLNSVDTVISKKSLQRYAPAEDHNTLENIYHLRYLMSRKQFKRAADTIKTIEQQKTTNKFDGYLAFAHAAIAESLDQDKDSSMKLLEQGSQIDPNFSPITTALANRTTVKTTF